MAKVAKQWLVWVSPPQVDAEGILLRGETGELIHKRIEVEMDRVVPDSVPIEVQQEWEEKDLVFEDSTKEHVAEQSGPPRVSLPPVLTQQLEHRMHTRKAAGQRIPPRPGQNVKVV